MDPERSCAPWGYRSAVPANQGYGQTDSRSRGEIKGRAPTAGKCPDIVAIFLCGWEARSELSCRLLKCTPAGNSRSGMTFVPEAG